ncbi:hypothetical protein J3458_011631 [Metarhizium acridum]|uniref:Uncharacterized protein n=1 Tax=Metarhizium acridum (strain CQMa 102) TaxID=655827 RepID=E9DUY2_METAQ|nr:uncharacterized protein MAC_01515 [Metarhizium acridum CQMa 102]EFY92549.1 hypothetical protein MAC_01515 [Metarhizium acridum CQMa 102]KAG8413974.1 hypothetical protein J3458_011631 [Metarhizium acridum]
MVNKYTIKVVNHSGTPQHYVLFNKPPQIVGEVQGQIWSNVFDTHNTPNAGDANFSVFQQYYGVAGTANEAPAVGVEVDLNSPKEVTLGSAKPDGTLVPGTTLQLVVKDHAPQLATTQAATSFLKAFEVQTGKDFTAEDAKKRNYLIGLGGSRTGTSFTAPAATFIPKPNIKYQIQPVNVFYVTHGNYSKGSLIDVTKTGHATVTIDFAEQGRDDIVIVHDNHGNFQIQA